MLITVQGGTGAGRKMHISYVPKKSWTCPDGHVNPGYAATCLTGRCRETRV